MKLMIPIVILLILGVTSAFGEDWGTPVSPYTVEVKLQVPGSTASCEANGIRYAVIPGTPIHIEAFANVVANRKTRDGFTSRTPVDVLKNNAAEMTDMGEIP